jgi:AbiV family abortive infection protein
MAKKASRSKTATIVSTHTILAGVFFALRQAWELLSAATILQEAGKFPSAYGLAVFCREEIGKSKLLEKRWKDSLAGKLVSAQDLNSGDLRSHARKLRAVGKVLSEGVFSQGVPPDPGSSEANELLHHIRQINIRARELDPDRTHLRRQRAFYVEMHEAGVGWWKPWDFFDRARSRGEILEAESAYLLRRLELEVLKEKIGRADVVLGNSLYLPPELTTA